MRTTLKEAISFHGHLGPYLILGILAGEYALKKLNSRKYFGLKVKVSGANKKPKSCLVDGLQLSTGATYGKGNIIKSGGTKIQIVFCALERNKSIKLELKNNLIKKLEGLKTHRDCEHFAKRLANIKPNNLFDLKF
ncbi:MAG: formylmethanofuran dehydrogenase subunit E family protein [Candidatus Omnitrophota bacterium]